MTGEGGADGGKAPGLFGQVGREFDAIFEGTEFEAVDGKLVGQVQDLGEGELRTPHGGKAGKKRAG